MENIYVSQNEQVGIGDDLDGIDLLNDDTFGAGAVEEDWELDHNALVGTEFSKLQLNQNEADFDSVSSSDFTFQNGGDHGRLFNRLSHTNEPYHKVADKFEDEVVDPAIVSLQKQSLPMHFNAPEGLQSNFEFANQGMISQTNEQSVPPALIDSTNIRHIWEDGSFDQKGGLQQMIRRMTSPPPGFATSGPPLQDDSIVSALKSENDSSLPPGGRMVVKAEDLEREMQVSASNTSRGPSPTFGISIPQGRRNDPGDLQDRSLPPRSVSPVFGSPSPSNMPIGTPPKHVIMDMMHQLEQQQRGQHPPGNSGLLPHPMNLPPGLPPPRLPFLIRGAFPPGSHPSIWSHGPPMPMHPRMAQDFLNHLRMRPPLSSPMIPPMFPANQRRGPLQHQGIARPNFRPEINNRNNNRGRGNFQRTPPARVGPGHLHPEHSKFVRMQQQLYNGNRRNYREKMTSTRDGWIGNILDPYANIMNQKEKDWVVKIQMMALQSNRPEIDDYYYQNYIEKKLREGKLNTSESDKAKRLLTPTKPNSDTRKYIPVQFQNSLGKLTASSVYNPRQIIDIVHSTNQEEEQAAPLTSSESQQTLSKRLVVYKKIEKAFELIVVIEELNEKSDEDIGEQREAILTDMKDKLNEIAVVLGLDNLDKDFQFFDENIFQILKIRKGKKLLARVMLYLTQVQCEIVVRSIFAHISILIKRDARDGVLHELYEPISQTISNCDLESILHLVSLLSTFSITSSIKDQVGVSIILKLVHCGSLLFQQEQTKDSRWVTFIGKVVDVIIAVANPKEGSRHARPRTPLMLLEDFSFDVFSVLDENLKDGLSPEILANSFKSLVAF